MFSYSYNHSGASMSRLDELLNRNQVIYQNLKQKLDGINKSNQNIYRNISHIQTSYSHDPLSQESSAIEREPTIKNTSIRNDPDSPNHAHHAPPLRSIEEHHQEVTFSEENNLEVEEELRNRRSRRILQEEHRLYELELLLEREKMLEEQKLIELEAARYERQQIERLAKRQEMERQIIRERFQEKQRIQVQKTVHERERRRQQQEAGDNLSEAKRESLSVEPGDYSKKGFSFQKDLNKSGVKNNSIYLSKIPKTSLIEADDEIPTFRQSSLKKQPATDNKQVKKYEISSKTLKPEDFRQIKEKEGYSLGKQIDSRPGSQSHRGKELKQLKELSTFKNRMDERPKNSSTTKHSVQWDAKGNSHPLDGSLTDHDPDINFQNTIARSEHREQYRTPHSELNSHFKMKLQQIEAVPQCILFAPFNKVYRSPILQLKPGCLVLQRKSKTSSLAAIGSRTRIVDGLRYKFKTVMTDQQQLLKQLFCSEDVLNFDKRESNKIAIVGGKEALKKKLHMGLLAYYHQQITIDLSAAHTSLLITLEHQTITPNEEPFLLNTTIQADPATRRLALMKLDKMINDFHEIIKKLHPGKSGKKVLRMTRLAVQYGKARENETGWSCTIISSNRFDYDFLRHLRVNKLVWCINPLVKHYQDVKDTLQSMRYYVTNRKTT